MKKKNLMRSLALCLCLCLCFAACSGTGGSSSTARPASSSGGGAEPAVQGNSITFPLAEAKEFSLMVSCSYTGDPNDLMINQRIAEDTNVNINWVDLGTGTERLEKLKLLLNSGDYGDGIYSNVSITEADVSTYAAAGVLIPLEDYITEELTPNLWTLKQKSPESFAVETHQDGHIYALPRVSQYRPDYLESPIWINKEWLEAVDMDVPTTADELYEVLKAFKETDCNGNGQMDEIPLLINSTSGYMHFEAWLGMWGIPCKDSTYDSYLVVQDGVVKFAPLMDEYKDFLKFMNKLYSEGLIYNECFTATSAMVQSLLDSPDAAFGVVTTKSLNTNADQYICIEPPTVEGYTPKWYYHPGFMGVKCNFMITDKCDDPQTLMAWIDRYYNPELAFQTMYGPEGIVFDKVDGKFVAKEPPTGVSFQQLAQDNVMEYTGGPGVLYSENFGTLFDLTESQIAGQTAYGVYEKFLNDEVWPRPYLQAEQVSRAGQLRTDIFNTVSQMKAKWITGEADIDATYDQFKSDLEKMGIEEFVSIYQSAYDAFNSAMNG